MRVQAAPALPGVGAACRSTVRSRRARRRARSSQSGLHPVELPPARCRRGALTGAGAGRPGRCSCSASSRPTTPLERLDGSARSSSRATTAARRRGRAARAARGGGAEGAWRQAFLARALPARRARRRGHLRRDVRDRVHLGPLRGLIAQRERERGGARRSAAAGTVTCRLHARVPGRRRRRTSRCSRPRARGDELEQWDEIKAAASEA